MAKFTLKLAIARIKELEDNLHEKQLEVAELVDDIKLDTDDNIFDSRELQIIKIYKYGFWILLALNIIQLVVM